MWNYSAGRMYRKHHSQRRCGSHCIKKRINVYMVSKETDSVCGPMLNQTAAENGAVYSLVNGDQPRNLLDICSWANLLGLEIIAAGKPANMISSGTVKRVCLLIPMETANLNPCRRSLIVGDITEKETLDARKHLLKNYTEVISADLCEMNLVSNVTGLVPSSPFLNYPVAKTSELANILIRKKMVVF